MKEFCRTCSRIKTCKKICEELESYLHKEVDTHSAIDINYVGSAADLEYVAAKHECEHAGGEGVARRVKPKVYSENWE